MSDEALDVGNPDSGMRDYINVLGALEQKAVKQSPCKGCLRRSVHPNCHITCDLYAEFVHYRQMYNTERQKKGLIYEYIKKKHEKKRR